MATGVLVVGVGRATRLLGYLSATDKSYDATIRLGQRTVTDDAEGDVEETVSAAGLSREQVHVQVAALTGAIDQVPSKVSAVKVDGQRAYRRVRAGESVELPPRSVTVSAFEVLDAQRPTPELLDLSVRVDCSSGTYVRALARDLGTALGVGGHLTQLRRTRVGSFTLDGAKTLEELEREFTSLPLADAVELNFPRLDVDDASADAVAHGRPIEAAGVSGPIGVFDAAGRVVALAEPREGQLRVLVGFRS
jgi:tRNA pseudouridine55 synthase